MYTVVDTNPIWGSWQREKLRVYYLRETGVMEYFEFRNADFGFRILNMVFDRYFDLQSLPCGILRRRAASGGIPLGGSKIRN
jgi:hypothetical protein